MRETGSASAATASSGGNRRASVLDQVLKADMLVPAAGLGVFLFWSYLKLVATFESTAGAAMDQVLVFASLGAEVVALAVAAALGRKAVMQPDFRVALVAAILCAVGSVARYWAATLSGAVPVAFAGSVLMAFGFAYFVCQWGNFFKYTEPKSTAVVIVMAFALSAALLALSGLILNAWGNIVLLAACPFAGAVVFWRSFESCSKVETQLVEYRSTLSSRFAFFAAGLITALMMGQQFFAPQSGTWFAICIVALVAFAVLSLLVPAFAGEKATIVQMCQASLALMLFGYLGMVLVGSDVAALSSGVALLGFLFVDVLAWCIPAQAAYGDQGHATEMMAKTRLLVNGGSLIGMALSFLAGQRADLLSVGGLGIDGFTALGVILLFSATMLLGGLKPPEPKVVAGAAHGGIDAGASEGAKGVELAAEEGPMGPLDMSDAGAVADALESERIRYLDICEAIGGRAGLSQREREVFVLLAQGRSRAFIQDELCISKGTANTHISSIYRKLDVHGQQELLTLFFDEVKSMNEDTRGEGAV